MITTCFMDRHSPCISAKIQRESHIPILFTYVMKKYYQLSRPKQQDSFCEALSNATSWRLCWRHWASHWARNRCDASSKPQTWMATWMHNCRIHGHITKAIVMSRDICHMVKYDQIIWDLKMQHGAGIAGSWSFLSFPKVFCFAYLGRTVWSNFMVRWWKAGHGRVWEVGPKSHARNGQVMASRSSAQHYHPQSCYRQSLRGDACHMPIRVPSVSCRGVMDPPWFPQAKMIVWKCVWNYSQNN